VLILQCMYVFPPVATVLYQLFNRKPRIINMSLVNRFLLNPSRFSTRSRVNIANLPLKSSFCHFPLHNSKVFIAGSTYPLLKGNLCNCSFNRFLILSANLETKTFFLDKLHIMLVKRCLQNPNIF
jgi:hypothetical protein